MSFIRFSRHHGNMDRMTLPGHFIGISPVLMFEQDDRNSTDKSDNILPDDFIEQHMGFFGIQAIIWQHIDVCQYRTSIASCHSQVYLGICTIL